MGGDEYRNSGRQKGSPGKHDLKRGAILAYVQNHTGVSLPGHWVCLVRRRSSGRLARERLYYLLSKSPTIKTMTSMVSAKILTGQ